MKIAVLSGKGGTGKTFSSVNLAVAAGNAAYVDCDVEEPNGRLFLKPENVKTTEVSVRVPLINPMKCSGCRKCVDFCRFHAMAFVRNRPMIFPNICHACGGCSVICPENAVKETDRVIGHVENGCHGSIKVITGVMNPGEESGVPLIKEALKEGFEAAEDVIIDCPPGSACAVMESVSMSDYCVLIAEPTAFGLHNFRMVYELVSLMGKPCCAVINKESEPYKELDDFCNEHNIPVALRIPYSEKLASLGARADVAAEAEPECKEMFCGLLNYIREAAK